METGKKSVVFTIQIPNTKNPKQPYEVLLQANKNYGICDCSHCRDVVLKHFQGNQINDGNVIEEVETVLLHELNKD